MRTAHTTVLILCLCAAGIALSCGEPYAVEVVREQYGDEGKPSHPRTVTEWMAQERLNP